MTTNDSLPGSRSSTSTDGYLDIEVMCDEAGEAVIFVRGELDRDTVPLLTGCAKVAPCEMVEGSSPAMLATLDSSIKQKQPVVVTLWQPHWAFSRYQLKVLEDPQTAFGPPDQMQMIATKGWSAANPEVAGWLKNFKITPEQLSSLMLKIQEAGKGQEQAATKQWITENQAAVDAWFKGTSS